MSSMTQLDSPSGRHKSRLASQPAVPPAAPPQRDTTVICPVIVQPQPVKAVVDVVLALLLCPLAVPVIAIAALLVRLTSKGPAFSSQTRTGRGGREFRIYKLRSMYHNAEKKSGIIWSTKNDPRVTPLGWWLRKSHVDELPQLLNVLKLEMSLVGPRPERPELIPILELDLPNYRSRLAVRPGVTGLAQVRLPADETIEDVRKKLIYDLYYIRTRSWWLDLRLMLCTGLKMFGRPLEGTLQRFGVPGDRAVGIPLIAPTSPTAPESSSTSTEGTPTAVSPPPAARPRPAAADDRKRRAAQ